LENFKSDDEGRVDSAPFGKSAPSYCKLRLVYEFTIELCPFVIDGAAIAVDCKPSCVLAFASLATKYLNVSAKILHKTTSGGKYSSGKSRDFIEPARDIQMKFFGGRRQN
jgi:hypothetical protein